MEVSKRLGNLLPRSMQDEWQQLLEMGTTKELGTQPGKEKSPRNPRWLHGDMLLGWFFLQQDTKGGWETRCCEALCVLRKAMVMSTCLSGVLQVGDGGEQKPRCYVMTGDVAGH